MFDLFVAEEFHGVLQNLVTPHLLLHIGVCRVVDVVVEELDEIFIDVSFVVEPGEGETFPSDGGCVVPVVVEDGVDRHFGEVSFASGNVRHEFFWRVVCPDSQVTKFAPAKFTTGVVCGC